MTRPNDDVLRRYLLQQLPELESDAVEAAYFADSDAAARLDDLEDDLAGAYLDDTLTAADRAAFEARLVQPAHAARLEFVRGMRAAQRQAATRWSGPVSRTTVWAAAAVIVLAVGGWWLAARDDETNRAPSQASTSPPVAPLTPPQTPVAVALALPVTATRSGGAVPTAVVPANADRVVLWVSAPLPPLADLTAEVRAVDVEQEWRGVVTPAGPGAPEATTGTVVVPVTSLPGGDYVLTVQRGQVVVARAFFRVVSAR